MPKPILAVDLDGTLCTEEHTFNRQFAGPISLAVEKVNKLRQHYQIFIYTARAWAEYNSTKKWLDDHGVMYDAIVCGKLLYHRFIEDRSFKSVDEAFDVLAGPAEKEELW